MFTRLSSTSRTPEISNRSKRDITRNQHLRLVDRSSSKKIRWIKLQQRTFNKNQLMRLLTKKFVNQHLQKARPNLHILNIPFNSKGALLLKVYRYNRMSEISRKETNHTVNTTSLKNHSRPIYSDKQPLRRQATRRSLIPLIRHLATQIRREIQKKTVRLMTKGQRSRVKTPLVMMKPRS